VEFNNRMSCATTNVKFRLKRGTTAQWLSSILPLALGEPGYDTITNDLKIGDGTSLWKTLPVVDQTLIKNVGLNAYIEHATFSGSYDATNQQVTYSIVLFGNSSRYDIVFTYADPNIPATLTPISSSPTKIVTNSTTIYDHSIGRSDSYQHTGVAPTIGGTYLVTMTVSTANAGGTGTGSTFSVSNSVSISSDTMGNPIISSSNGITLNSGSVVRISGIDYYTSGTVLTIPASALQLNNIYNIVNSSDYTYLSDSSPSISDSTTNLRNVSNGNYPGNSGVNATWHNLNQITANLNASSFSSPIYTTSTTVPVGTLTVTNALSKTSSYYYDPIAHNLTTGTPTKIAYVSPWNSAGSTSYQNEIIIPKNQGGTTNAAIGSQTRARYFINSGSSLPYSFNFSEMVTFDPSSLYIDEPLYFPFDGNFYASSPPFGNYIFPSSTSFNPGTKYLCIAFTNSAPLANFTLKLSGSTNISNIYVAWYLSNSTSYGWYNGSIPYNDGTTVGCQYASPTAGNTIWYFNINSTVSSAYSTANLGGKIYVIVKFTGVVPMNQILFT